MNEKITETKIGGITETQQNPRLSVSKMIINIVEANALTPDCNLAAVLITKPLVSKKICSYT